MQLSLTTNVVIEDAEQKLRSLEDDEIRRDGTLPTQSDLFVADLAEERDDPLVDALRQINMDELTPKEALNLLYELKSKLKS